MAAMSSLGTSSRLWALEVTSAPCCTGPGRPEARPGPSPPTGRADAHMKRGRVLFVLAVVAASLLWVAAKGLSGSLIYYQTPTELLRQGSTAVGERLRLGGLVAPGSVQRTGSTVRFIVTDGTTRMSVVDTAGVPSLFRDGKGVVLEGTYGTDGAFHADTVLVKHSDCYRPPTGGATPNTYDPQEKCG
ncbi:MAG: cytochrome c maturation protein CcmE [Actinobacteria bacterium]|nr:MAG: cytochrome c maturation protein CcmE [Actinomycetota bacterium]